MSLLEFLLNSTTPMTSEEIAEKVGRALEDVENELDDLLSKNNLRKRVFLGPDGSKKSVYWTSSLIPFVEHDPIISNPFDDPFDHQSVLERLSDQQLQQEKVWIQTKLRKINSEYENLQCLAKKKISEESEKKIDEVAKKWLDAIHDMLYDLLSKLKKMNSEMNMNKLLRELRIDPKVVKWNPENEDFDE